MQDGFITTNKARICHLVWSRACVKASQSNHNKCGGDWQSRSTRDQTNGGIVADDNVDKWLYQTPLDGGVSEDNYRVIWQSTPNFVGISDKEKVNKREGAFWVPSSVDSMNSDTSGIFPGISNFLPNHQWHVLVLTLTEDDTPVSTRFLPFLPLSTSKAC